MKKIPTVLRRNPDDRAHVIWFEMTPGLEWIVDAVPTRKYDGTCVMLDDEGRWWARREVKIGAHFPENYVVEDFDPVTGKHQGWEPITQSSFYKYFVEAQLDAEPFKPGTHELIGPKINGNPEKVDRHYLIPHADATPVAYSWLSNPGVNPLVFHVETVMELARVRGWEGIVWHHPDGRMAKLKVKDLPKNFH